MNKFARILLTPNGRIHIALRNTQTYECSANAVSALLRDPVAFEKEGCMKLQNTTRNLNLKRQPLNEIPGLTLAEISSSGEMVCSYTHFMCMVFDAFANGTHEKPLTLDNILDATNFKDMKECYLNFFMRIAGAVAKEISIENKALPPLEIGNRLFSETFDFISPRRAELFTDGVPVEDGHNTDVPENLVSFTRYCELNNFNPATVRVWLKNNKLASVFKDARGRLLLDPNEIPEDRRKYRSTTRKERGSRKNITLKGNSFEDLQEYIAARKLVTDAVRPFIRSFEEAKYYENHNYHEVFWNGKAAMIIDINPEYYCERLQMTNRQLIEAGKAPVVPQNDTFCYHLHHIGQKMTSPFAIIPEFDHNGKETYLIFHQGSSEAEDIHSKTYEMQKAAFWKTYLEKYDEYKGYLHIPYNNPKNRKDKR